MTFVPNRRSIRQPLLNAPPVVLWLIAGLVACHVIRIWLPGELPDAILARFAFIPARYAEWMTHATIPGGWPELVAPLITYMLLHADYAHIGINSIWLLVFGPAVARWLGAGRFLLFFVFCGIVAALVHLAVYWGSPVAVIGASGAISGLMAAGMRILYGQVYERPDGLAPILSRPIVMFSLVWTGVNIVSGVFRIGVTGDVSLVAWVAHLGGYFAGLLTLGLFLRRTAARLPWVPR
ncbi:MAG TPA: rhomboid family intramembrane serine protease [Micropepsaceae bacterium]|nr:rhomboid family intramembrane serine protease [Micropepsaceae bacterium]